MSRRINSFQLFIFHLRLLSVERRARSCLSERSNERSDTSRERGDSYTQ